MTTQRTFNPVDFGFEFTAPEAGQEFGWYRFDRQTATKAARKARDSEAKRMANDGYTVRKFSMPNQLITRGGIGSGRPQIEEIVTVFGFNAAKA